MLTFLQLKAIKNKKVRAFYESQNDRLNDWLEVDALVMALADDVLDSMDPDADNDGRRERHGGLQDMSGNIWEFLPEDEKKRRQDGEKKAKWVSKAFSRYRNKHEVLTNASRLSTLMSSPTSCC